MANLVQQIQDGRVVGNTTAAKAENGQAKTKSTMNENKEMFLKLLVAEMQYQDPMEPKDNAEYVKELSQFTQVETLNSIQDDIQKLSSDALVGKYVQIDTGDNVVEGKVDYVTTQSGTSYVSVDGNTYKVSDITTVSDPGYFEDTTMAENLTQLVDQLPDENNLTLQDEAKVKNVVGIYDGLSMGARGYVSSDTVNRLDKISSKMTDMLIKAAEIESEKQAKEAADAAIEKALERAAQIEEEGLFEPVEDEILIEEV